jgi:hypothetical protein
VDGGDQHVDLVLRVFSEVRKYRMSVSDSAQNPVLHQPVARQTYMSSMCTAAASIIVVDAGEYRTFDLVDFRDLTGNDFTGNDLVAPTST